MITTKEVRMSRFGLIGKNIDYSFSRSYFTDKFKLENLPYSYENFDIQNITLFPKIILENPDLKGLNVTIPYKEEIIPYLNDLGATAREIGAVNTIKITSDGSLKGYNTDYWGFKKSLQKFLPLKKKTALILGTGGASKAIAFALQQLDFDIQFVSRNPTDSILSYSQLTSEIINSYFLIVNCTPLGTFPNIKESPSLPFQYLNQDHVLFDLIYNPSKTEFLRRGELEGAKIENGLLMLQFQAEKAWEIWNF